MITSICIFGDSITCGYYDLEKGGWADRLWVDLLNSDDYHEVYKLAIDGDTTDDLLKIMDMECKAREPGLVIVMLGANDALYSKGKGENQVPVEKFKENLKKIFETSKNNNSKLLFVGIIPQDEKKLNPLPWEKDLFQKSEDINKYNEAIKIFCQENELAFLDLLDILGPGFVKFSEDGSHPNAEGHKIIFEEVKKFLIESKLI